MKITFEKVIQYVEGNLKMLGDQFGIAPNHICEQVLFRHEICKDDCVKYGYCINCGCSIPGKFYVTKSCNDGERFPDLMGAEEWEAYKKENNIEIG